jgi:hypothetical protein
MRILEKDERVRLRSGTVVELHPWHRKEGYVTEAKLYGLSSDDTNKFKNELIEILSKGAVCVDRATAINSAKTEHPIYITLYIKQKERETHYNVDIGNQHEKFLPLFMQTTFFTDFLGVVTFGEQFDADIPAEERLKMIRLVSDILDNKFQMDILGSKFRYHDGVRAAIRTAELLTANALLQERWKRIGFRKGKKYERKNQLNSSNGDLPIIGTN